MYSLCLLAVVSCLFCLALTPLVRDWSARLGVLDQPDHARKIHLKNIPRTGGIPILLAYVGSYGVLLALPLSGSELVAGNLRLILDLLPPVALVFTTGLLDDCLG